ncbi:MAG TPA: Rossmann-like and DUF2520 domain-containing protein [Puia sp.]|nr:Rossmann-like and DUF2520 domain-containing protein [Puia sp.]
MKTVIIGSGNVAWVFGEKIVAAGHEVCQVLARSAGPAAELAGSLDCPWATAWDDIDRTAGLYLVAISDSALPGLNESIVLPGKLLVHTAGAAPASALAKVSERCGVIWPLQSLRAEVRPYPTMPLIVDANRSEDLGEIASYAGSLSGPVVTAGDDTRLKLHVAATLVNNFTNYLYSLAAGFCGHEGIDFGLLFPLIRETALRLDRYPPEALQTGPARRGDIPTIARHMKVLHNFEEIRQLYNLFSIQIEEHYRYERIGKI